MSKILFLADIHGNMPAVLALEKEIDRIKPDDIYFVGDAIGKGPENDKTLAWVRKHCNHFVAGNWDLEIAESAETGTAQFPGQAFYWNQLSKEDIALIKSWPLEDEVLISGFNFRIFHGRPLDNNYHAWLNPAELAPAFTNTHGKKFNGFISADCHQAYIRECSEGFALNTGSVGNALGVPACHALLIEGNLGLKEAAPINMTTLALPYDNKLAVEIAGSYPDLPGLEAYINEVLTGVYSR